MLKHMEDCDLKVRIPAKEGAVLYDKGPFEFTVRENTVAIPCVKIRDGKIDFKNTNLEVKDAEGKDQTIDGPLLLAKDRDMGLTYDESGQVHPPEAALWG